MAIKLVVTDIDGTIIGKDEVLHPAVPAMVRALAVKGVTYTVATGRVAEFADAYAKQLGLGSTPYVACNGGSILVEGTRVHQSTMPLAALRPVVQAATQQGMSVLYSVDGCEHALQDTEYVQAQRQQFGRYPAPRGIAPQEWDALQLDKLIVMAKVRDGKSLDSIEALCRCLPQAFYYKRYADKAIDILPADACKELGVARLAAMLGIGMHEVMAVGDDRNDVEMLRCAGVGVAVANAQGCVKQAADYVATAENYLGVIEAVEKFCLKGEKAHG